jgi:hypothetical protein
MPSLILFPGPGDPRLVIATVLLTTVLIVLQVASAGAGLA